MLICAFCSKNKKKKGRRNKKTSYEDAAGTNLHTKKEEEEL